MRRLYQRRADTMVFVTIAAISIGVLVAYFEMQDREVPAAEHGAEKPGHLLILATGDPGTILLEPHLLEGMPHLEAALDEAAVVGRATIEDPAMVDAIWFQLADAYGIAPRVPLVVEHEGGHYRLQMVG